MRIVLVLLIGIFPLFVNGQDNWLTDKNGCKIYNPYPTKNESVEWTGNCVDSIASGYGQLTWFFKGKKGETKYVGYMENGRPEGEGKYTMGIKSYKEVFEGKFTNGEIFLGKRTTISNKDTFIYVGELKNWQANGKGEMFNSFIGQFTGEFEDDYYKKGVLTISCDSSIIESANWEYFIPKSGKRQWLNGTVYEGELKNYQPHGKGTIVYPNGQIKTGKWRKGNLIKNGM